MIRYYLLWTEGNFLVKKLCHFKVIVPLQKYSAASELLCNLKNIVPLHKIGLIGRPRQTEINGQN